MAVAGTLRIGLALALLLAAGAVAGQDFPPESLAPPLAPSRKPVPVPPPAVLPAERALPDPAPPPAPADPAVVGPPVPVRGAGDASPSVSGSTPRAAIDDSAGAPAQDAAAVDATGLVGAGLGALRPADADQAASAVPSTDSLVPARSGGPPPHPPEVADPFDAVAPAGDGADLFGAPTPASNVIDADPAPAQAEGDRRTDRAGADPVAIPPDDPVPGIPDVDGVDPAQSPLAVGELMGPPAPDPEANEFGASPLTLLGAKVAPGSRERLRWTTGQSFSGSVMETPVIVIHGQRPGPRLCLVAGVHGDELNGVETVRRLAYGIEPEVLAGTVIAVPIVNLLGFSRGSRYLPDRRDLNRFFPGSPGGSSASRIAHSFFAAVVDNCDALVDFHTGSFDRANLPQVRADLRDPAVVGFTRGFGATAVLHSPGSPGMLRLAASRRGIPAVTFEIGAPLRLQPEEIEHGVQAIQSLMHQMNMVATRRRWTEPQAVFYESRWVRVDQGGMLFSELALGDRVEQGQLLGRVIDPVSNRSNEVRAPEAGRVIGMALNQLVLPGFAAYHLGVAATEEKVVIDAAQEASPDDERFMEYDQLDGTSSGGPQELDDPAEATSDEPAEVVREDRLEDG